LSSITVVKLGGSTLGHHDTSLDDIASLYAEGHRFVIVHGGGATISEWLDKHEIESRFVRGLRVTDERALEVVVAVLAGLVNKRLVAELAARGAGVIGLSGADGALIRARRYDPELGFVGDVVSVDAAALTTMAEGGAAVVLAPIAIELTATSEQPSEGEALGAQLLNLNADTAAGQIAASIQAERLVFLTDVPGVKDGDGVVLESLNAARAQQLLEAGVLAGGMVPKVEAALLASSAGVQATIADGREEGALRAVFAGSPIGTRVESGL
jgi:acetylglutamate kinase